MTEIFEPELVDVPQMVFNHPDTFFAPEQEKLRALKPGDSAKICDGRERFWAIITEIHDDYMIGEVNNNLIGDQPYVLGSLVKFTKNNIYDCRTRAESKLVVEILAMSADLHDPQYSLQQILSIIADGADIEQLHAHIASMHDRICNKEN